MRRVAVCLFAAVLSQAAAAYPRVAVRGRVPQAEESARWNFRVGLGLGVDGAFGSVASGDSSSGLGWSVTLRADVALSHRVYVSLIPGYQVLGLSRDLNFSSAFLVDPGATTFHQTIQYASVAVLGGLFVHRSVAIEGGVQYLTPVGATQTVSPGGTSTSFTAKDHPLLLLLGPALEIPISPEWGVLLSTHLFYNLAASGSKFFGARLQAALNLGF